MAAIDAMICKGETFNCPCFGTQFESRPEIRRPSAVYNVCGFQTEIMQYSQSAVREEEIPRGAGGEHSTTLEEDSRIIEAVSYVCNVPKGFVSKLAADLSRSGKPVNIETLLDKCMRNASYEKFYATDVTKDGGCEENGLASGDSNDSSLTSASQSLPSSIQASENASLPSDNQRQLNSSLQNSPPTHSDNSSPDHRQNVSNSFQRPLVSLPTISGDSHVANSTQSGLYNAADDAGEDCTDGGNLQSNDGLDTWLVSDFSNPYVQISDSILEYMASPLLSRPLTGAENNLSANTSQQYELGNGKPSMAPQKTRDQAPIVQQNSVSGSSDLATAVSSQEGLSCRLNAADVNLTISQNRQDIVCDGADCEISCQVNEPQNIQGVESKTDKTLKTLNHIEVKCCLLERENELLQNARLCCSCHKKPREVTFLPCGHFITCGECAEPIYDCPFCEKSILATINTFLS